MAAVQRINSTDATGSSASWTPAGDFVVQGEVQLGSRAVIEVYARLAAGAPWVKIESIRPDKAPFVACRKLPEVKLVWGGNTAGDPINAWSAE